jgi:hypothetical protein
LDEEYNKGDLHTSIPSHIDSSQSETLLSLPSKYEDLLSGIMGTITGLPYTITIKHDSKPFARKTFGIPHIHVETVKKEIKRLQEIGVITPDVDSPWASLCFIIPKHCQIPN